MNFEWDEGTLQAEIVYINFMLALGPMNGISFDVDHSYE